MNKESFDVPKREHQRRTGFCVVAVLTVMTARPALAQDLKPVSSSLAGRTAASGRKTVAVVDFTDLQGNVTELGRFLAEELSVALVGDAKGFRVIDRTHLKAILQEHKLATTGLIDPQTARQLGQIAGVDTLVTGTITAFGDNVRLSAKVLDTTTAEMIAASTVDVPKTKAIEELLARGIGSTQPAKPVTKPPVVPGTGGSGAAKPTQKEDDFSFELKSCQRSGMTILCRLLIANEGDDRQLMIGGGGVVYSMYGSFSSRAFDQAGNEYKAATIRLGNKENDAYAESLLVSGVPTNATLTFERVSADANRLALLEIGCSRRKDQQVKVFTVQIRNISLGM